MHWADGGFLALSKKDLKDFCKYCGTCCENLVLTDKIEIFLSSGRMVTGKVCKYHDHNYSINGKCTIHNNKPKRCTKWKCGVPEKLSNLKFNGA